MILGAYGKDSLCVVLCLNRQKGFGRNFSLVLCLGWGNPAKVSTNDFPHVMVMMCCVFDHQSWLLAPNLTISFLSWNYQ